MSRVERQERHRQYLAAKKQKPRRRARRATPETTRNNMLWSRYRLRPKDFDALMEKQSGRCAICGTFPGEGEYLHVDHCHNTGEVRGLLCLLCNTGLGKFKDNPELLRAALEYLED